MQRVKQTSISGTQKTKELERAIEKKFDIRKRLRFGSLDELFKPWLILAAACVPTRWMSSSPKFPLEFLDKKKTDNVFFYIYLLSIYVVFSVPSSEPSNVTLKNLKFDEVIVEWDPIPQHTVNGIFWGT